MTKWRPVKLVEASLRPTCRDVACLDQIVTSDYFDSLGDIFQV